MTGCRPLPPHEDPFYVPPNGFESQARGAVLRYRPIELALFGRVLQNVPAWQLLYRSSDLELRPEAAVTTVLLPASADPNRPRPLLTYQCAIDAVIDSHFPSYALQRGARATGCIPQFELLVIANALRRGWAVSIPDHEGLGGHFGAAREPGYRVLDGVRAAVSFPRLHLHPDAPVAVWGYSCGGMASSWAVEMASSYAPELGIVGAVLGAPVGDPGQTLLKLNGTWLTGLPTMVIAAIRHAYPDLNRLLDTHATPAGLRRLDEIETLGTVAAINRFRYDDFDDYLDAPLADLLATPAIVTMIDGLRLGHRAPTCPLLVVAPVHDQFIDVVDVDGQVDRYLDAGAHVQYLRDRLSEHITLMPLSAPTALDWLTDRIDGKPLPPPGIETVWSTALSLKGIRGLFDMALVAAKVVLGRRLTPGSWSTHPAKPRDRRPAA